MLHVRAVAPGGPAARAGLRPGDLITTVNGERIDFGDELELLLFLGERKPGERLRLVFIREGREKAALVIVGELGGDGQVRWQRNLEMARRQRARRAGTATSGVPAPRRAP